MYGLSKVELGKLIISAAKSLKGYQLGDPKIASFLYGTSVAGRLGLFASAIRSEKGTSIFRRKWNRGPSGKNVIIR